MDSNINVTLKGGVVRAFPKGISAADAAKEISMGLYRAACACRVDGELRDLRTTLDKDCALELLTFEDEGGRKAFWHTASHILAQAVLRLYPDAKLAIGPAVDGGFYYDFDVPEAFSAEDLLHIEEEMKKIVKEALPIEAVTLPLDKARELMAGQPYKLELMEEHAAGGEALSFYRQGEFTDLCAGPHLMDTSPVKAFKLTQTTGAYWRGSAANKMLCRVYGTAFPKASMLTEHLERLEEAKKRDHNKLGRELEFFTTSEYIGQGLPILMPKGAKVIQLLQRFVEDEEARRGYQLTKTPFMAKSDLYKISGHWYHYREGMFVMGDPESDEEVFALRPMTCPFQFQVYLSRMRSYRELPLRYNETSTLFRNEASGEMHGLIRLRQFTISEGHIACRPDQLEQEFADALDLAKYMLDTLGLSEDVTYRFSKWDPANREKYIGDPEQWENVQGTMRNILQHLQIPFTEAAGEAAFYGPKLDIQIRNVHGKEDTLVTIQIDFQLAERFGMEYIDADGSKKYPYVIHRTSIGCYERTLALLIEKYAGALPVWLSPVQVKLLPISERFLDYAQKVEQELTRAGIRCEIDWRNEKIGYKIREAQVQKIPYMLILGEKEQEAGEVSVRSRSAGDLGAMELSGFISRIGEEIESRTRQ